MLVLRILFLSLGLVAIAVLTFSISFSAQQFKTMTDSKSQFLMVENQVKSLGELEKNFPSFVEFQSNLESLNLLVDKGNLIEAGWVSKSVVFKGTTIQREGVSGFLKGVVNESGKLFVAEEFSLSTLGAEGDLFHWKQENSSRLNLEMVGEYMVRRAE